MVQKSTGRVFSPGPAVDLEISGRPLMADQELNVSATYWEGAVGFSGTRAGQAMRGEGYVAITGYAETMAARL